MVLEPNNLISEANDSGVSSLGEQSIVLSSSVESASDIDLYKFQLNKGQGITLDIDTVNTDNNTANFDSYLRLFDADGNELTFNDDYSAESEKFSLDSYLGFIANQTGEYYVGVSSIANNSYNPVNGDNANPVEDNFVAGDYDLTLNIVEVIADQDTDNTISEAIASEANNTVFKGEVATESDVNIYKFELDPGKGINLKVKTDDSNLDSFLRVFDAQGDELTFDDNSGTSLSGDITTDSAINFAPDQPGEYFVGVSSAGNFEYDAVNGDTNLNLSPNTGISKGSYELELNMIDIVADNDVDNTIAEAVDSGVTSTGERSTVVSGEINPELDVDLYQVNVSSGDGMTLDLNTAASSDLDSFLRVFDAQGKELIFDDNDDFNVTGDFSKDSALVFAPTTPGEYYIGVSASGNFDYDPVNGRNNFSDDVTSPFSTIGNYDLQIDVVEIVADSDVDNTLVEAIDSGVTSAGEKNTTIEGEIDSASDTDIYKFQLDSGAGITLDLNTASSSELDSYLRLFNADGQELEFNDDYQTKDKITDSLINFVPEDGGEYYIGVSSGGNSSYDPVNGSDNFTPATGYSTGSYELGVNISTVVGDEDPDNTISEAINTEVSSSSKQSTTISDAIASESDSDLYEFQLAQGEIITLDVDAAELNTGLDSVLRLFDADGNELTTNDDKSAPGEGSNTDSFIEFTAPTSGKYYAGVSSYGNFDYDPVNGSTNFSNNIGSTTGNYDLVFNITGTIKTIDGTEQADSLNGTEQTDLINGLGGNDTISGAALEDTLVGGSGDDSLRGNDGDDLIQGNKGKDDLFGGAGNDTLDGGEDSDRLYGNAGSDIFVLSQESNADVIADFEDETDKIMLTRDLNFSELTFKNNTSTTGTTIMMADKAIATLVEIDSDLITETDFL